MALRFSSFTRGSYRTPAPQNAGEVVAQRFIYTLPTAQNVTGEIIDLGILPANTRVVDMILDSDDLDTNGSPVMTVDVGIMSGSPGEALNPDNTARTCGAEFFAAATVGQAGTVARPTLKGAFRAAPAAVDRSIGLKVLLQAATPAQGEIGLTVLMQSAPGGSV
jgi:hypothetical protein